MCRVLYTESPTRAWHGSIRLVEEPTQLLGQVKAPIAMKEGIDNSALKVIRLSVLAEHGEIARIARMCVDWVRLRSPTSFYFRSHMLTSY